MKRIAIFQVRTASTRLPNKCLLRIFGKTVLEHIIRRIQFAKRLDGICVATTDLASDDIVERICNKNHVLVFRGSETDVLDRFYHAAKVSNADVICRVTADDALKDPGLLDTMMRFFEENTYEYVSNTIEPTYPDGLDLEIMTFSALAKAWENARLPSEREHVTPYIWKHPEIFRLYNFRQGTDLSALRWTLDRPEDWVFVQQVYDYLYSEADVFLMDDVLKLLEKYPRLKMFNQDIVRNEGYMKSLAKEEGVSS